VSLSTQSNVALLCVELDRKANEYRDIATTRANAEVDYKAARARRRVQARIDGAKSVAEAEMLTDADPSIEVLWRAHLIADAVADAAAKSLFALRTRIEFGRSVIATERAGDVFHAAGLSGAA
jgi:K+/H+ antiporter YhaU regulatory subunit KhtT